MKSIFLKIGEHIFHIQSQAETMIAQVQQDYSPFIHASHSAKADLYMKLQPGSGVTTTDYQVQIQTSPEKVIYERSDYWLEVDAGFRHATLSALDPLAFKHALMNLYSALIVHQSWGLLLHSSCLEESGKAILFAGRSGAGKSTVAKLSLPRTVFSDEATIVKMKSNGIEVLSSPFNSELKTKSVQPSRLLSAIYLLVQSQELKTQEITRANALCQIIDKVFYWPHENTETRKVLQLCKQLVDRVPIFEMYFQKNNRFWELIS